MIKLTNMPKIYCCLCSRRTDTPKQRVRAGTELNWSLLEIHSEKNGLDIATFSNDDYLCLKCHSTISHYRMKDRGPKKITKNVQPISYEPGITKNVLRGYTKPSSESNDDAKGIYFGRNSNHETSISTNFS